MVNGNQIDHQALERACYCAARNMMWAMRPVDTDRIQEVANSLCKFALEHEEYVVESKRDPNIIVRCVDYFAQMYAIPPMRDDIRCFQDMFQVLLNLTVPESTSCSELEEFYRDIEMGLETSRTGYFVPDN